MRKTVGKFIVFGLGVLFLPCILTLLLSGTNTWSKQMESGKYGFVYEKDGKVQRMNLDTYIMGAIAANMPLNYEMDTLKAQAVIIRTYAYLAMEHTNKSEINISDIGLDYISMTELKEYCQKEEYINYLSKLENAVYSTNQEVITYNDKLITPLFHTCNGGVTRSSLVARGEEVPYLISTDSKEDMTSTDAMKITLEEVQTIIDTIKTKYTNANLSKENFFEKVQVTERDEYNYAKVVQIDTETTTAEEFAECLNLNSTNFQIENYEGKVRIICKGKGHGIGLSQYGANEKVKNGATYQGVLEYYYCDTRIKDWTASTKDTTQTEVPQTVVPQTTVVPVNTP